MNGKAEESVLSTNLNNVAKINRGKIGKIILLSIKKKKNCDFWKTAGLSFKFFRGRGNLNG